ncbi:MAG: YabP/YqfC family sporulation protein [Oscillospiraceae bacterium]|nr:YabP/YqfC family sporulation protein [Oscillospiraceae bacterium]
MPKQKISFSAKVRLAGEALDVPARALPGFCHIELMQNRQAVIEGVKGVLGYSEDEIKLNMSDLVVTFRGQGLTISGYQQEALTMSGTIFQLTMDNGQ